MAKDPVKVAYDYFKANINRISSQAKANELELHAHLVDLQNAGLPLDVSLPSLIAICSSALNKPVQSQLVVLGDMTLGGTVKPVVNLADSLQVGFDAGSTANGQCEGYSLCAW